MTDCCPRPPATRPSRPCARWPGPTPRLREDQWTAIEALVDRAPAGAGRAAHRLGQVGGLLRRDRPAAGPRRRPDGHRQPAARAHAQPGRRRGARAGTRAVTVNSSNVDEWGEVVRRRSPAGEVDVLLVSPERLNNPGFRDAVLPAARRDDRPARRRRGALHLRLGPRLPARLPPHPHAARRAAGRARRCSPRRPPRTRAWSPTSPSSCPARHPRAARLARPRQSLHLGGRGCRPPAAPAGLAGRPPRRRCRAPASSTRSPWPPPTTWRRTCAAAGVAAAAYSGPHRRRRAPAGRGRPARQPDQGAGGDLRARHGLRQARPRLRGPPRRARRRRSRTTSRSAAPAAASTARRSVLLPGARGRGDLALLRLARLPRRGAGPRHARRARRRTPAVDRRAGGRGSTCGAPGSRRCSRCSTSTARCAGSRAAGRRPAQPWAYDAERYARVAADRAAEQQAMRDYAATAGCRMEFLRRQLDDPEVAGAGSAPCGRCDRCTGVPLDESVTRRARSRPRRPRSAGPASSSSRASSGRPAWPRSASTGRGRIPADRQADSGRALGRLSDIGWGTRLRAAARRPRTGRCPTTCSARSCKVLAGWGWEQRPAGVVAVPSRGRPLLVASLAERLAERRPAPAARHPRAHPRRARAPAAATARSGCAPSRTRSPCPPTCGPPRRPPGAARRRPARLGLDGHRGRPAAARGRRRRGAAARARRRRLTAP